MQWLVDVGEIVEAQIELMVVGMFEDEALVDGARALDQRLDGALSTAITRKVFTGKWLDTWSSLTLGRIPAEQVLVLGLGPKKDFDGTRWRQAMGKLAQLIKKLAVTTVGVELVHLPLAAEILGEGLVEGLELGSWEFSGYHQTPAEPKRSVTSVTAYVTGDDQSALQQGIKRGTPLASAQNLVRELGWRPSSHLDPERLALIAQEEAEKHGLKAQILDEGRLAELKMGALLGVGQGSKCPPRMVVLRYQGGGSKTLALVGKGITFDSGGISLKPPANMEEMKYDMLGAGAVLAAMCAIAELRPALNVIGVMAIAQNMPSGSAYKPGDVVTAFNGKTIEVTNTDAEGRVVLADGVSYAVHLGADYIVEASTLTGAALVVLGHQATAMVATDDDLAEVVLAASEEAGERVWRLPIYPEYKALYKSAVADIKNSPGRDAGTITGGMIIGEFAGDVPFAHLDIAGTAWTKEGPLNAVSGPTGDGDRAVGAHGEDEDELLQVWAEVLRVTPGRRDGALGPPDSSVGPPVGAGQGHRRRVVVQLRAVDGERHHRVEDQPAEEAGPVSVEQQTQCSADPVVVQEPGLAALESEQYGVERRCPLAQRVDRLVGQCQVAHQHAEALGRCQLHPAVCRREE